MVRIEQTYYEVLDPGRYNGVIQEIEASDGEYGPQVKFVLELESGSTLFAWASAKFSNRSKLYQWTRVLMGRDIPRDYVFESGDFVGLRVLVNVSVQTKDDGTEYNRVDGFKLAPEQAPMEVAAASWNG